MPHPPVDFLGWFAVRDEIISEIRIMKSTFVEELSAVRNDIAKIRSDRSRGGDTLRPRQSLGAELVATATAKSKADQHPLEEREYHRKDGSTRTRASHAFGPLISGSSLPTLNSKAHVLKQQNLMQKTESKNRGLSQSTQPGGHFGFSVGALQKDDIKNRVLRDRMNSAAVTDYYYKDGCFQKVARDPVFEHVTLGVIVINALWMAFDTDQNHADTINDADVEFVVADVSFFSFFVVELFIRFCAFQHKVNCLFDGWFVFDSALVTLYMLDPFLLGFIQTLTGGSKVNLPTSVLRLLRLARLSRLTRLLRSFPELMIMIKGMITALATVGYTLGLLGLVTYVFAIAIRNLVPADTHIESAYFISVPETMHHLILFGTFLDSLSTFIIEIKEASVPVLLLSWLYIALSALLIMNMLTSRIVSGKRWRYFSECCEGDPPCGDCRTPVKSYQEKEPTLRVGRDSAGSAGAIGCAGTGGEFAISPPSTG